MMGSKFSTPSGHTTEGADNCVKFPFPLTVITKAPSSFLAICGFSKEVRIENLPVAPLNPAGFFNTGNGFTCIVILSVLILYTTSFALRGDSFSSTTPSTISCSDFLFTALLENSTLFTTSMGSIANSPARKGYSWTARTVCTSKTFPSTISVEAMLSLRLMISWTVNP